MPYTQAAVRDRPYAQELPYGYRECLREISRAKPAWAESGVEYARILEIAHSPCGENGALLVTFEELKRESGKTPGYPVFYSADRGDHWERRGYVTDPGPLEARWNPHLYELPCAFGGLPAGTVLLAGVSLDREKTAIVLYQSGDTGRTFARHAVIAEGGSVGGHGVYEPFLLLREDGTLICYYSDETAAERHSQRLVLRTSRDGVTWSDPVTVAASTVQTDRPGMPVVTPMGGGRFFMVYEVVGREGNPIYCRTSADGLDWGDPADIGTPLVSTDGKQPGSAPYCGWLPQGTAEGILVVSATFMRRGVSHTGGGTDYFISRDGGTTWETAPHPIPYTGGHVKFGYSNGFTFSASGAYLYAVNNPGADETARYSAIRFARVRLHAE